MKDNFARVRAVGLTLPNVEATAKYDGSPVLKDYYRKYPLVLVRLSQIGRDALRAARCVVGVVAADLGEDAQADPHKFDSLA